MIENVLHTGSDFLEGSMRTLGDVQPWLPYAPGIVTLGLTWLKGFSEENHHRIGIGSLWLAGGSIAGATLLVYAGMDSFNRYFGH